MTGRFRSFLIALFLIGFAANAMAFRCQVCGKDGVGEIFIATDEVTGEKEYVCSDCAKLSRCYICGLPVKTGGMTLKDGRILCARDARTVVVDPAEARRTCLSIQNDLDRQFSRFMEYPVNVDIQVIDRIDLYSIVDTVGNTFESPDIQGWHHMGESEGKPVHEIRLMTGLPLAELKEVCAHELSHAWVADNVSKERHARIDRDAEEGFCEMMGYLYTESQNDEAEKKRILANLYTRGQVQLFIEAAKHYGMQDVLDWMQYGETSRLVEGHIDQVHNVKMPAATASTAKATAQPAAPALPPAPPRPPPSILELEGLMPGAHPMAIINHHTFAVGDEARVRIGTNNLDIRCLAIQKDSVHIKDLATGQEKDLFLSK